MPAIRLTPDAVTAQERIREKATHLREARTVLLNVVQGEQGGVSYLADWAKIVRGTVAHAVGLAMTHWRQVLKRATTILVSVAAVACETLSIETKPTPTVPLTLQRETAGTISTPIPTVTATLSPTPKLTETLIPTATSKPTETLTPTPTAIPEWGVFYSGEKVGMVDPRQIYPLVGAVNRINRSVLPIGFVEGVKFGVYTANIDLTTLSKSDYENLRTRHSAFFNTQQFANFWLRFKETLRKTSLELDKTTVIWDPDKKVVKMVVWQDEDEVRRFSVETDGSLTEIKEYNLLPRLRVEGPYILRDDVLDPKSWTHKWGFKLHNTIVSDSCRLRHSVSNSTGVR